MTNDEIVKELAENLQRAKSNTRRIEELERNQEVLCKLATSVQIIANNQKNLSGQVDRIECKLSRLEEAPMRRLRQIIGYVAASVGSASAGAFLGYFFN